MTTITVTIQGDHSLHACDATKATPPMERKYAAILLAGLDAVADCLSGAANYEEVMAALMPYLNKRRIEMQLPSEDSQ